MESSARVWIEALRGSQRRLADLAGPLSPEQVRGQSYDTEWSIAQVLSHLGSQAEISRAGLDAAVAGQPQAGPESFQAIWAVWDARTPDEQAAESLAQDAAYMDQVEGLTDSQLDGIRAELFGMTFDAAGLVGLRLGEHAVHTWDVAVMFDPAATVAADAVALLMDRLAMTAGFTGRPTGEPWRVLIETTGPEQRFLVDPSGERVALTAAADGESADARVRMPAEALLRLVYGRLDPGHTPPVEIVEGGPDVLDRLRAIFPGF